MIVNFLTLELYERYLVTIWQGYWRGDSTMIWLNLTFLTTTETWAFGWPFLANQWIINILSFWYVESLGPWSLDQGGTPPVSTRAEALRSFSMKLYSKTVRVTQEAEALGVFLLLWGCPRVSLSILYLTILPENPLCEPTCKMYSVCVYSVGTRFVVRSFLLSRFLGNRTAPL